MKECSITLKVSTAVEFEDLELDTSVAQNAQELRQTEFVGLKRLGLQYGLRTASQGCLPSWRLDPDRVHRYEELLDSIEGTEVMSRRTIARAVGIIIWHLAVVERPLCYASTLIAILRSLSTSGHVMSKKQWDESVELTSSYRNYLGSMCFRGREE